MICLTVDPKRSKSACDEGYGLELCAADSSFALPILLKLPQESAVYYSIC